MPWKANGTWIPGNETPDSPHSASPEFKKIAAELGIETEEAAEQSTDGEKEPEVPQEPQKPTINDIVTKVSDGASNPKDTKFVPVNERKVVTKPEAIKEAENKEKKADVKGAGIEGAE
jgi:hypothetical protein